MRQFFDTYYGSTVLDVPVLSFYEDYHREHLKEHLAKLQSLEQGGGPESLGGYNLANPFKLEIIDQIRSAERRISRLISERWQAAPTAEEIVLTLEDLQEIVSPIRWSPSDSFSASIFGVFIPGHDDDARFFFDKQGYSCGYGKLFSRFLYLLPEELRADLVATNASLGVAYYAEICGDGGHNANLHPPLLRWEISYPTGESGLAEEQLQTTDIVVERHPDDDYALILRHAPSGNRVVPLDLGFANRLGRPQFFQLLCRFTPPCEFGIRVPEFPYQTPPLLQDLQRPEAEPDAPRQMPAPRTREAQRHVTYRPRIVLGSVVFTRRAWRVPINLLPRREAGETSFEFFLRVDRWRREHGIPRETYVQLFVDRISAAAPAEKKAPRAFDRGTMNMRKPQFIDMESPLFVDLLAHLAAEAKDANVYAALFEERYPSAEQLSSCHGERYALEQLIQLSIPGRDEATSAVLSLTPHDAVSERV